LNGILASTAIPLPTEITTSALIAAGHNRLIIFIVLAISTYIGGFIGYWIGRSGNRIFRSLSGKPKKEEEQRTQSLLHRYGWMAIVASAWVPIVGDFIPIVAGTKKYDLRKFAIGLSIGKISRAIAVVYLSSFLIGNLLGS
jgi:membrane protein YqaA with SNARE-associated domain